MSTELLRRVEEKSGAAGAEVVACQRDDEEWLLPVHGTGFEATFGLRLDPVR